VGIGILVLVATSIVGSVADAAGAEVAVLADTDGAELGVSVTALAEVRAGESKEQAEPMNKTTTTKM
jgi:hypothetical protein